MRRYVDSGRGPFGDIVETIKEAADSPHGDMPILKFWEAYFEGSFDLRRFPLGIRRILIITYPIAWSLWWPTKWILVVLFFICLTVLGLLTIAPALLIDFIWCKLGWLRELWSDPVVKRPR